MVLSAAGFLFLSVSIGSAVTVLHRGTSGGSRSRQVWVRVHEIVAAIPTERKRYLRRKSPGLEFVA